MGDHLKKVQSGQPLAIPAAAYNAFIDAANDARARRADQGGQAEQRFFHNSVVSVQNTSGTAQDRFAVLGIDTPIFSPADNLDEFAARFALKGVTPAAAHIGRFAVLAGPAGAGDITQAYVAGVCPVKVNVTDSAHAFADVADATTGHLDSAASGSAAILWKESGTGVKWAIVRLGGGGGASTASSGTICKIISAGSNGVYTVRPQEFDTDIGTYIDSGADDLTAHNLAEDASTGSNITSGYVYVSEITIGGTTRYVFERTVFALYKA